MDTILLKVVTLGVDATVPAILPLLERLLKVLFVDSVQHSSCLFLNLLHCVKSLPFELCLHSREDKKVTDCQVGRNGNHVVLNQKLLHFDGRVGIVMVDHPVISGPQLWALEFLMVPQMLQHANVVGCIDCLSL